jgi:dephospho-CoA kinase
MTNLDRIQESQGQPHRRVIGLTGGIGMGKTTASDYLSEQWKVPVLDADVIAREVVVPGSAVLSKIAERYGSTVLLPDGRLDRVRLGEIVFNSLPERHWLERQIHPPVRDRLEQNLQGQQLKNEPVVILSVPLLFEARMTDLVNEIWVVCCPMEQQINRLMTRSMYDGIRSYRLSREQIQARIDSQMPIESKMQRADVVLDNSGSEQDLFGQIDQAMRRSPHEVSSYS